MSKGIAEKIKYNDYINIEKRGSNSYFSPSSREYDMFIDFENHTLKNIANETIKIIEHKDTITFWIGFQENVIVHNVLINNTNHEEYQLYYLELPSMIDYKMNYLVINKLNIDTATNEFQLTIEYSIRMSNSTDDMWSMLENRIGDDEFHLMNLWQPVIGNGLTMKDIMTASIPSVEPIPYSFNIKLSKPGILAGEGRITKLSKCDYNIKNYDLKNTKIFICGGDLQKLSYKNNDININFYYRRCNNEYFTNLSPKLFQGFDYLLNKLNHFESNFIDIFCMPIIAGGYGFLNSLTINENSMTIQKYQCLNNSLTLAWHEFTHRWWGNMIYSGGKAKYLLTEGITVLYEFLTAREVLGNEYFNCSMDVYKQLVLEISGFDNSVANANRMPPFGNVIVYKKGFLVLYELLGIVGEDTFINYCNKVLDNPGYYEWTTFLEGLEKFASINLSDFTNQWIDGKEVPKNTENKTTGFVDSRCEDEKKLDESFCKYINTRDNKMFNDYLLSITPQDSFWNKYHYHLSECERRNNNIDNSISILDKLDRNKDKRYYFDGLLNKAIYLKKQGLLKESKILMEEILTSGDYLENISRRLIKEYKEVVSLSML